MSVYAALYDNYIAKAVSDGKIQKKKALKKMMKRIVKAVLKNGFPPVANNSQQIGAPVPETQQIAAPVPEAPVPEAQQIAAPSGAPVPETQQIAAPVPEITPVVTQ